MNEQPQPEAATAATPLQDRYRILKAAELVLVEDGVDGRIVGIDLLFGGVVTTQAGAANVMDMLFEAMCKTGFRMQALTRLPVNAPMPNGDGGQHVQ